MECTLNPQHSKSVPLKIISKQELSKKSDLKGFVHIGIFFSILVGKNIFSCPIESIK